MGDPQAEVISAVDSRWFRHVRREFCPRALEYAGRPITYVEIGVWHGASAMWVCENILTHPASRGFGIDPYLPDGKHRKPEVDRVKRAARRRLRHFRNWNWLYETSRAALTDWQCGTIDLLYLDGSHLASDVLADFVLAWPHLTIGSGIIFDDLLLCRKKPAAGVPQAITAIMGCFGGMIEPWGEKHKWQYAVKVLSQDQLCVEADREWSV